MTEDGHYLTPYLDSVLPELGLDAETYGTYVTGFADDDEGGDGDLDDLIELLRASSETHGDDDDAWSSFRREIVRLGNEFRAGEAKRQEEKVRMIKQKDEEKLQHEIRLAKEMEVKRSIEEAERQKHKEEVDPAKAALMAKYAYDESVTYDADGKIVEAGRGGGGGGGEEENVLSNRAVAAKMSAEQREQMKAAGAQSKKSAREATARAKMEKTMQKEERRKRASKGERRR